MSSSRILRGTQRGVPGRGISAPTQIQELCDSLYSLRFNPGDLVRRLS
jgi:hypothetical protein